METDITSVRIHRFHDRVAMWDGIGDETVYLSAKLALNLAESLMIVAHDVNTRKFSESSGMTRTVYDWEVADEV